MLNSPKFQFNSQVLVLEELTRHCEKPRSDDKQTLDSALKEFELRRDDDGKGRNNPQELAAIIRPAGKALPFCGCVCGGVLTSSKFMVHDSILVPEMVKKIRPRLREFPTQPGQVIT